MGPGGIGTAGGAGFDSDMGSDLLYDVLLVAAMLLPLIACSKRRESSIGARPSEKKKLQFVRLWERRARESFGSS